MCPEGLIRQQLQFALFVGFFSWLLEKVIFWPKPGFEKGTIWGCFPTPDDCLQASWQGPFFLSFECHFCAKTRIFMIFDQNDSKMISKSRIVARRIFVFLYDQTKDFDFQWFFIIAGELHGFCKFSCIWLWTYPFFLILQYLLLIREDLHDFDTFSFFFILSRVESVRN